MENGFDHACRRNFQFRGIGLNGMAIRKRLPLPAILSANALLEGDVVYHDGTGWSPHLAAAFVAADEAGLIRLEAALDDAVAANSVVEPELVPVTRDAAGLILPSHYRERIRALGPTIRTDLGPQARGEHAHVSL